MNFDEIIDRRATHSAKWDRMEKIYGVPADDGIAMWVADMDFRRAGLCAVTPCRACWITVFTAIMAMTLPTVGPFSGG